MASKPGFFQQSPIPGGFRDYRGQEKTERGSSGAERSGPPIPTADRAAACPNAQSQQLKMTYKLPHGKPVKVSQTGTQTSLRNPLTEVHIPSMKETRRKTMLLKPAETPDLTTTGIHGIET